LGGAVNGHFAFARFIDDSLQGIGVFDAGYLDTKVGTVWETRVTGSWRRRELTDVS
jgi:hypothetical protein